MQLIYTDRFTPARYVFESSFQEFIASGQAPKEAGFRWDHNARHWFTEDETIAARLRNYADGELRQRLTKLQAKPKQQARLTFEEGEFIFRSDKKLKDLPKEAGFFFAPNDWKDPFWHTEDPEKAAKLAQYADAECRRMLEDIMRDRQALRAASRASAADVEIPVPVGLDYLPYQKAGIAFGHQVWHNGRGVLIADDMGLGKTIQAIGLINQDSTIRRVLVICPASLKLNWYREMTKWLVRKTHVAVAESSTRRFDVADIYIINYDLLAKKIEFHKDEKKRIKVDSLGALDQPWDLVVCDEAHLMKNPDTQRSAMSLALVRAARRVAFLTGTPIVNRPKELFTLIHALDPKGWPSFFRYARRYCMGHQNQYGHWDFSGAAPELLDELQNRLRATIMVRRLKKDVLKELPPKVRQVIEIPAGSAALAVQAEQEAWKRKEEHLAALKAAVELAKASDDPAVYDDAVLKLRQGVGASFEEMSRVRHETALAKVPYVVEHIKSLIEDDPAYKVIVFAHHQDVIAKIEASFGSRAVTVTGATSSARKTTDGRETSERQMAVDRFQEDPACQVFVGNIIAAGVGLTLTASSHVVFCELDWVPGNITQAEDRAHRIGQKDSVLVQHIVLEGSIDADMAHALVSKQQVIEKALDKETDREDGIAEGLAREQAVQEVEDPVIPLREEAATKRLTVSAIEKQAKEMSPERVATVHLALRMLAGMCDGARALDGSGFNRIDTGIGHSLAASQRLTPKQAALGAKVVQKYHCQLPANLLDVIIGKGAKV